jgi:hypothetical protein
MIVRTAMLDTEEVQVEEWVVFLDGGDKADDGLT